MAGANVNIGMIQKQIAAMKNTAAMLERIRKDMLLKYQTAGCGWRDKKYEELGSIVQESSAALTQIMRTLSYAEEKLGLLLKEVEAYERVNIKGNADVRWVNGQAVELGQIRQEESIYYHRMKQEDVNLFYKSGVQSIDETIENYRKALMARGVPDGEWMQDVLSRHRAILLENLGYDLEMASGQGEVTVNRHREYTGPEANPSFFDELAEQYQSSV